jgi:hypothetical protein
MPEIDDYRANLAVCYRMAAKAFDALEKRAWLDMAESWKLLIICREELLICREELPLGENIDAATRAWPRSLQWPEFGRLFGGLSSISIPRVREWLMSSSSLLSSLAAERRPDLFLRNRHT